jgi:phage/conjugal plasmid C-4 type zinc finger TraR family protein
MRPEDRAQQIELEEWEARQERAIMPKPTRPSAKWCEAPGCGERIPDERRKAIPGVQYCVDCQELKEQQEKRGK